MANEFSGSDRRALEQMIEAMNWIERRDGKAKSSAPTSAISTRVVVNPTFDNPTIWHAFENVKERCQQLLDMQKGDPAPTVEINVVLADILYWGARSYITQMQAGQARPGTVYGIRDLTEDGLTWVLTIPGSELDGQELAFYAPFSEMVTEEITFLSGAQGQHGDGNVEQWFLP